MANPAQGSPELRGLFGGVELRVLERGETDIPAAAAKQLEALRRAHHGVDCHVKRSALSSGTSTARDDLELDP